MRTLRKVAEIAIPLVGMFIVLAGVIFFVQLRLQIIVVIIGILVIEAGIWKVAHPLLPNERRYLPLRAEGDDFIRQIRRLNTAALACKVNDSPENRERIESIRNEMIRSVDRMVMVAGKTREDLETEHLIPT